MRDREELDDRDLEPVQSGAAKAALGVTAYGVTWTLATATRRLLGVN